MGGRNGVSQLAPFVALAVLHTWPSDEALARLRSLGVTHLTVHVKAFEAERGADALAEASRRPELEAVQTDGDVHLYRLH